MNKVFVILVVLLIIAAFVALILIFDNKIKFTSIGLDSGFKISEIDTLWKLAKKSKLKDPMALYVSTPTMNHCIAILLENAKNDGSENSFEFQSFLEKLYKYRTRVALESENKGGLENTRSLKEGQRLQIILKGKGVFSSKLLSNGRELVISMPKSIKKPEFTSILMKNDDWINKEVAVYFARKGDANYAFDTIVFNSGLFRNQEALFIKHSYQLERMQKRQSIRCDCEIYAQMYIIRSEILDYNAVETESGYRCLLEDISEDGAMIRIGGKGENNVHIKLQFKLNGTMIMMYGIVRGVEYNPHLNQSRLHFECTHLENAMHNAILTYVYNVLPEEQKELQEVITELEEEEKNDSTVDENILSENGEDSDNVAGLDKPEAVSSTVDAKIKEYKDSVETMLNS